MTYKDEVLKQLGISAEQNTFEVTEIMGNEPIQRKWQVFESDDKDNLVINFFRLSGGRYTFRKEGVKWVIPFQRTRLKAPIKSENGEEIRYLSPQGSGMFPFFPPSIIQKYQEKKEIPVLFLIEGEKKAFKASLEGLDIVGIPSIHGFYDTYERGRLHADLQELLITSKVEKVVFLTDADTLVVKWASDKDLSKRQKTFAKAVRSFRESLQILLDGDDIALNQVYFMHISREYLETGKGLDDLLINHADKKEDILTDIQQLQFAKKYFRTIVITAGRTTEIYKYFGLNNEQDFYQLYRQDIGNREFSYNSRRYQFDGEVVRYMRHEDADKFVRITSDWYKLVGQPNPYGHMEFSLVPFKVSEIKRDYAKFPDFLENIPKYDALCNEPDYSQNYRRTHNGCYNLAEPLQHEIKEGSIKHTLAFLKHLFGGQGFVHTSGMECADLGDTFTVALDWLTIFHRYPKQMLPVPILVSKENITGKSSFLKWLQAIYKQNSCILNNQLFNMPFNGHYIGKNLIGIDESNIEIEKKAQKERLKQMVTSDTAYLEDKGVSVKKISFHAKLVMCSNDAEDIMKMDENDTRWFVVKVPKIKNRDPDLVAKMIEEIPAWLHYITNRQIVHPKEDRLWFSPDRFITEQFRIIIRETRSHMEKELTEMIIDMFKTYSQKSMLIDLPWLTLELNRQLKYKVNKTDIKKFLHDKKGMQPSEKPMRCRIPIALNPIGESSDFSVEFDIHVGRPYTFLADDWLDQPLNDTKTEEEPLPF